MDDFRNAQYGIGSHPLIGPLVLTDHGYEIVGRSDGNLVEQGDTLSVPVSGLFKEIGNLFLNEGHFANWANA